MSTIGRPEYSPAGDGYRYTWPELGLQIEFDRIGEGREGIYAEILAAQLLGAGKPSLLHASRMNLLSPTARANVARALITRGLKVDWNGLLEAACFLAVQRFRDGEPTIDLRQVDPYERPRWLLKPYVEHGGPTVLFAPGGTGKTYLALAIAVTVASGKAVMGWLKGPPLPVLFLDWETDKYTHAERLQGICAGAYLKDKPPVYYRHMVPALAESVSTVRREVDRLGIGFCVVDSLGNACGGELESAENIIRCFTAVRAIGLPTLIVSHVSHATKERAAQGATGRLSPFGSVYTENQARNTWSVHRSGEEDTEEFDIALVHEKTNNGRYQKRHGYHLAFVNDTDDEGDEHLLTMEVKPVDLAKVPDFEQRMSVRDRIVAHLRSGAQSVQELTDALGADPAQVRARLRDLRNAGQVISLADHRMGLAAQR